MRLPYLPVITMGIAVATPAVSVGSLLPQPVEVRLAGNVLDPADLDARQAQVDQELGQARMTPARFARAPSATTISGLSRKRR